MAFKINAGAMRENPRLGGSPFVVTKSDTAPALTDQGTYPRGFQILTGGTLTVWVEDPENPGYTKKRDLVEVPDGWTWTWGGIFGICATDESGTDITVADIIGIP